MLSNSLARCFQQMAIRPVHSSSILSSSVFMKRQKKIDPEVAKSREKRKRRKLEKEIRDLQRSGKQPKPVTELTIDPKIEENIAQYQRSAIELLDDVVDERAVITKAYCKSQNQLIIEDNKWIRQMITEQEKALKLLKEISPSLYDEAIKPDAAFLPYSFQGPVLTAPIKNYRPPDGDYTDTTPTYEKVVKK